MLNFQIHLPQFFVIALANFMLGWIWYSPGLFMRPWAKALGKNPDKLKMTEADKKKMPMLFSGALISSFALSFVLQVLIINLNAQGFAQGAMIGLLACAGFVLPTLLGTLWEGRKSLVVAINLGNYVVACIAFGGILGIWR